MKIGVDISTLQGPHRMRGIGYTVINTLNNLPAEAHNHSFVLFMHPDNQQSALELLKLDGISYEIRTIRPSKPIVISRKRQLITQKLRSAFRTGRLVVLGNSEGVNHKDLDWFWQFDQSKPLPPKRHVKSLLILYDLIPYVVEHLYLNSYRTARKSRKGRASSLVAQLKRSGYIWKIRINTRRAARLVAISEHTKADFVKFAHVNPNKIEVCWLGVSKNVVTKEKPKSLIRYESTSWGPIPREVPLPHKPFLLFVGGADPRRKLVDLVAAFNNLRAEGKNINLVLSGDSMFSPDKVGSPELSIYLKDCPFLNDIYFLGFTTDKVRDWLYQNALAFVYPSIYEGFGLPILEAFSYGTPVITYRNSSIVEVGDSYATYANDYMDISRVVTAMLNGSLKNDNDTTKYVNRYTWLKTARAILKV